MPSKIIKTDTGRAFFHAFKLIEDGYTHSGTLDNDRLEVRTFSKGNSIVKLLITKTSQSATTTSHAAASSHQL